MDLLPRIPEGEPADETAPKTKPGITVRFDTEDEISTWKLLADAYNEMDSARGQKRKRKWSASSVLRLAADVYLADVKKRFGAAWPKSANEQAKFLADVRARAEKEVSAERKRKK